MKMTSMIRRIATLSLVLVLLSSLTLTAAAKNVCKQINGAANKTTTFTVDTGNRWLFSEKLTLKQKAGSYSYINPVGGLTSKTGTGYYTYTVKYVNNSTGASKSVKWSDKTLSLSLDKNTTYTVTVTPAKESAVRAEWRYMFKSPTSWKVYPSWSVSSTKGILACN